MGILDRLWRREQECQQKSGGGVGGASVRGRLVKVSTEERAMRIPAFRHGINLRAQTAARAVLKFERKRPDGKWEEFSKGCKEYRHLNRLMQVKPNRWQSAAQMWKQVYMMRDLRGHAGVYLRKVLGQVDEMVPVGVDWVPGEETCSVWNEELFLRWDNVPIDDVLIIKGDVRRGYPLGRSLVWAMEDTLSSIATTMQMCRDVMSKGGTFRAIVRQERSMDPLQGIAGLDAVQMEKHTDDISSQFNEGKDFIYDESAAEITPISQSFQDLQVGLQRSADIEDVARGLDVPLPLMFCSTNAVYKSVDDAWQTFKVLTIAPILEEVEQELNAKLLTEEDWDRFRFKFYTDSLCLDSHMSKAQTAGMYVQNGIKTVNEIREEMGLAPMVQPVVQPSTETEKGGEE